MGPQEQAVNGSFVGNGVWCTNVTPTTSSVSSVVCVQTVPAAVIETAVAETMVVETAVAETMVVETAVVEAEVVNTTAVETEVANTTALAPLTTPPTTTPNHVAQGPTPPTTSSLAVPETVVAAATGKVVKKTSLKRKADSAQLHPHTAYQTQEKKKKTKTKTKTQDAFAGSAGKLGLLVAVNAIQQKRCSPPLTAMEIAKTIKTPRSTAYRCRDAVQRYATLWVPCCMTSVSVDDEVTAKHFIQFMQSHLCDFPDNPDKGKSFRDEFRDNGLADVTEGAIKGSTAEQRIVAGHEAATKRRDRAKVVWMRSLPMLHNNKTATNTLMCVFYSPEGVAGLVRALDQDQIKQAKKGKDGVKVAHFLVQKISGVWAVLMTTAERDDRMPVDWYMHQGRHTSAFIWTHIRLELWEKLNTHSDSPTVTVKSTDRKRMSGISICGHHVLTYLWKNAVEHVAVGKANGDTDAPVPLKNYLYVQPEKILSMDETRRQNVTNPCYTELFAFTTSWYNQDVRTATAKRKSRRTSDNAKKNTKAAAKAVVVAEDAANAEKAVREAQALVVIAGLQEDLRLSREESTVRDLAVTALKIDRDLAVTALKIDRDLEADEKKRALYALEACKEELASTRRRLRETSQQATPSLGETSQQATPSLGVDTSHSLGVDTTPSLEVDMGVDMGVDMDMGMGDEEYEHSQLSESSLVWFESDPQSSEVCEHGQWETSCI
ncbi:hypothetical protein T484DRAFT_1755489 [Baffinella frigidus]|nr:hypothetical protein T484DRAFT_1755489 [Cryptophyta sp. CCMP2293]